MHIYLFINLIGQVMFSLLFESNTILQYRFCNAILIQLKSHTKLIQLQITVVSIL